MTNFSVRDRNAGFAAEQAQVWGFDKRTGIDSRSYFAPGAKIFYVDPNNTQAVDLGNLGEDPTVPLATIAAAVTLCRAYQGDTIVVGANDAWQYSASTRGTQIVESVTIPYTKGGIRIVGAASYPLAVSWAAAAAGEFALTVEAADVHVEGFTFVGAVGGSNGIYAEWDGATMYGDNLSVRSCLFADDVDTGIQLEYSWYCDISYCYFDQCDAYGIHADVAGSGFEYCFLHNNRFVDCGTAAIAALGGCGFNIIHGNWIWNSDAQTAAVATNEGINTTGGDHNMVTDNYFSCLLPVPANGDYDDLNTAAATDAWINNHCMDGDTVTNPT